MAAAYLYAEGSGPIPQELLALRYLDRFGGAMNVYGRPLGLREMERMDLADRVVRAFMARAQAAGQPGGWSKWETENPGAAQLLKIALILSERSEANA